MMTMHNKCDTQKIISLWQQSYIAQCIHNGYVTTPYGETVNIIYPRKMSTFHIYTFAY